MGGCNQQKPAPMNATAKTTRKSTKSINPMQRIVCATYGDGDFAHYPELKDWRAELDACGNCLFKYLMIELSTDEDCDDDDEAIRRLRNAADDIANVIGAFETKSDALPDMPRDELRKHVGSFQVAKALLMKALADLGVKAVEVVYAGKFEHAEIQSVKGYTANNLITPLSAPVQLDPQRPAAPLNEAISTFTFDLLRAFHPAFMKYEGGNGKLRILVANDVILLRHVDYRKKPSGERSSIGI